jgi:hypothetical protein
VNVKYLPCQCMGKVQLVEWHCYRHLCRRESTMLNSVILHLCSFEYVFPVNVYFQSESILFLNSGWCLFSNICFKTRLKKFLYSCPQIMPYWVDVDIILSIRILPLCNPLRYTLCTHLTIPLTEQDQSFSFASAGWGLIFPIVIYLSSKELKIFHLEQNFYHLFENWL